MFRDLFQVVLPLLIVAGALSRLDENPRRVVFFGVALVVFGLLGVPFFIVGLPSTGERVFFDLLRILSCLLGGAYLLVRVRSSRRRQGGR